VPERLPGMWCCNFARLVEKSYILSRLPLITRFMAT
jgi:hypothetical protein